MALAGLWNTWTDLETGELVESYTYVYRWYADQHPLLRRMHKQDPALGHEQDKRSVVALELRDVDCWLLGGIEEARDLIQLTPLMHSLQARLTHQIAGAIEVSRPVPDMALT